jgi:hypothetical protein
MKSGHRGFFLTLLPDKKKDRQIQKCGQVGLIFVFQNSDQVTYRFKTTKN